MLKDCTGREIREGDEVAFAIGNSLKTGVVAEIKAHRKMQNSWYARVRLTEPEMKGGYWEYNQETMECEKKDYTLNYFRNVTYSQTIAILRPLDNSNG